MVEDDGGLDPLQSTIQRYNTTILRYEEGWYGSYRRLRQNDEGIDVTVNGIVSPIIVHKEFGE
jgi:hypothetical protein